MTTPYGDDLVRPSIRIVSSSPAIGSDTVCGAWNSGRVIRLPAGSDLEVDIEIFDDRELAQFKLDIHHNFDCHGHSKRGAADMPWQQVIIGELSGTHELRTERLSVPANALVGDYHIMVHALDAAGNEAPFIELSLKIFRAEDTLAPVLELLAPERDSLVWPRKDTLHFNGTVSDNLDLAGGSVELSYVDPDGDGYTVGPIFFPVLPALPDQPASQSAPFAFAFRLPGFAPSGNYTFTITAYDARRNAAAKRIHVQFID